MRINGQGVKLASRGESYRLEAPDALGTHRFWISFNAAEQQISSILRQAYGGIQTLEFSAVTRFTTMEHEPGLFVPDLQKRFDTEVHVLSRYCSHETGTVETFGATFHQE